MNEKGVSPVIGVILMVAITVILAAVIASFVFGLGGTVKPAKTPGFSVTRVNASLVQVVLTNLGGAYNVSDCNVTIGGAGSISDSWSVGTVLNITTSTVPSHIVIRCKVDGVDQVVLDTTV